KTAGLLGKNQREWLRGFLDQADEKPTVLFVHHTLGENDGELLDADKFLAMVRPHRKVKAIFYGHSHIYSQKEQEGMHLVNLPAVGYNFNDREPLGWVQADFRKEGVDLTLRAFAGNTEGNGKTISLAWR
ncbi:MAG: metallophosphoesterase family protein, partial [Verrucomicrobiales bacterium]